MQDKLRFARELRSAPTQSEDLLWNHLRKRQLKGFKFRRQAILYGYIADFYCPERKLVVEVDGPIHAARRAYDQERDRHLEAKGMTVIRFASFQVDTELGQVLASIGSYLHGRSRHKRAKRI